MAAIKGVWRDGKIVLKHLPDWPEDCEVIVRPISTTGIVGMTEEEQGDDPESIARWLAEFDSIPPLEMTPEEEASWYEWRQKIKEYTIAKLWDRTEDQP